MHPMLATGFIPILLGMIAYGLIHSLLASQTAKRVVAGWLGADFEQRWYRLTFNIMAGGTLLPVLVMFLLLPDQRIYAIPMPWVLFTLLVQAAAGLGLLMAVSATGSAEFLGLRQMFQPQKKQPSILKTGGLYAVVRHPIYTCSIILLWLMPVMSWNMLGLVIGSTLYFFTGVVFEERKLLAEFGEEYAAYRRSVPMIVPGLRRRKD